MSNLAFHEEHQRTGKPSKRVAGKGASAHACAAEKRKCVLKAVSRVVLLGDSVVGVVGVVGRRLKSGPRAPLQ